MKTSLIQKLTRALDRLFDAPHHLTDEREMENRQRPRVTSEILERVIDGTDPKIRLVGGHRQRLTQAIAVSLDYIEQAIDCIPSVVRISSGSFVTDTSANAFFTNPRELRETLRHSSELVDYFQQYENYRAQSCWALLCMRMTEREILGMDLSSEQIRRDVRQVAVSFRHHHFQSPAPSEADARAGLKGCLFEGLITSALAELTELRARRRALMTRLRIAQGRKREHPPGSRERDRDEIELSRLRAELKATGLPTPAACLQRVVSTFLHPERFVRMRSLSIKLDKMGIRVDDEFTGPCNRLDLAEAHIGDQPPRIVVLAQLEAEDFRELEIVPTTTTSSRFPEIHVN